VIPNNFQAGSFEASMQLKLLILTALFFVRHQGGTEALDDFFTFARKHIDAQPSPSFVYEQELTSMQLLDEQGRNALCSDNVNLLKNTVKRLLHASQRIEIPRLFSLEPEGFRADLVHMQLRSVLRQVVAKTSDEETRLCIVKLLLRQGLMRGSCEDLLLAAQL